MLLIWRPFISPRRMFTAVIQSGIDGNREAVGEGRHEATADVADILCRDSNPFNETLPNETQPNPKRISS